MDMSFHFANMQATRANVRKILKDYSIEQLNTVPEKFTNNLLWHYGHIIVTQQLLCYKLAGLDMYIDPDFVRTYSKGSKPEKYIDADEYGYLQKIDVQLSEEIKVDYASGKFNNYSTYPTSYGVTLSSIEEAIIFNNIHEGHHFGNVLSMRKLV
jgi:hypothetical protein